MSLRTIHASPAGGAASHDRMASSSRCSRSVVGLATKKAVTILSNCPKQQQPRGWFNSRKKAKAGRTCPHSRNEDMTHMIISSALFGAAELIGNRWTNRRGHFCVRQVTRPRSAAGVRSTHTTGRRRPRLDAWETVRKEGVTAGNIKVAAGSRSLRPPSQINENIKQSSFLSEFPGPKRRKLTEVSVSSDRVNSHRQTTSA